ncbi:ABC transporter substrate-binding protein [Pyxidicoccus fallax]|uniref:ABC transporter substrate-binding protein n=1 Tax=Pyxidicoccus fallax TaxID=394095 RepID=A0A848L8D0_9BACT|nr:ABC transporter substrate-binding protein [Pyxidicoccus fallax]NMO14826.1 ABC transporter substrate-binding protein [Pyxidicoccus fallax]NPC76783.1 ABC transporter substrate-binding protein [Pyxidicoccus fallax]
MNRAPRMSWLVAAVMMAASAHAQGPGVAPMKEPGAMLAKGSGTAPASGPGGAAGKQPVVAPRLVTVGPAVTETVFALGAGAQVVGVDDTSLTLQAAAGAPKVGYLRALSAEAVLATGATQVLVSEEAGPPNVLEQLKTSGVEVVVLPNAPTVEASRQRIRTLADRLGRREQGAALIAELDKDLERAAARVSAMKDGKRPRILALYARGGGVLMVAGTETPSDALIRLAGGVNAVSRFTGHKPLTAEAVVEAAPDIVLLPASSATTLGGAEGLKGVPGLSQVRGWRLVTVEDVHFMSLGPSVGKVVARVQDGLAMPKGSGR